MDSTEHEVSSGNTAGVSESEGRSPLLIRGLVFALLTVVLIGIFSEGLFKTQPDRPSNKTGLQKLGLAYHEFHRLKHHSPTSMDELKDFLENPPPPPKAEGIVGPEPVAPIILPPLIINQIYEGALVVRWSAVLTDSGQQNDKYLLAYPSDIEEVGGSALTAAGRVVELTTEEFKDYPLVQIKLPELDEQKPSGAESEETTSAANESADD